MTCRRIALFDHRRLLGESIERLLLHMPDIELLGPWEIDQEALSKLHSAAPDLVIIVSDLADDSAAGAQVSENPANLGWTDLNDPAMTTNRQFISQILETCSDLPVIRVDLEEALVRVYRMHTLPAHQADLVQAILLAAPGHID